MKLISVQARGNRLARVFETYMGPESLNYGVYGKKLAYNKFEGFSYSCELLIAGVRKSRALKVTNEWLEGAQV